MDYVETLYEIEVAMINGIISVNTSLSAIQHYPLNEETAEIVLNTVRELREILETFYITAKNILGALARLDELDKDQASKL